MEIEYYQDIWKIKKGFQNIVTIFKINRFDFLCFHMKGL